MLNSTAAILLSRRACSVTFVAARDSVLGLISLKKPSYLEVEEMDPDCYRYKYMCKDDKWVPLRHILPDRPCPQRAWKHPLCPLAGFQLDGKTLDFGDAKFTTNQDDGNGHVFNKREMENAFKRNSVLDLISLK